MWNEEQAFMLNSTRVPNRKMQKAIIAYIKERIKQREQVDGEVAKLEKLLKENLIDENTHARLNELLEIDYEQKWEETREKYGFVSTSVE
jgi:hypothetical protein